MPFPEVTRVLYRKNPLDQVICQLRFPPILKIDAEVPARFQDGIRSEYPEFSETSDLKLELPKGLPDEVPQEVIRQVLSSSSIRNYQFSSEDGVWRVNLTRTFLALTTVKYERWETFREKLTGPLDALLRVYSPIYFSRVGLRYVDVIRRSPLGLADAPWAELLSGHVAGFLSEPNVAPAVHAADGSYEIALSDSESNVRIRTRLVQAVDTGEPCFMIDSDFYTTRKTPTADVSTRLQFFNSRASRLIQWCITPKLHNAMEPQPL